MNFSCSFCNRSINLTLLTTSAYLNSVRDDTQIGGRSVSIPLATCALLCAGDDVDGDGIYEFVFGSSGGNLTLLFFCLAGVF